MNNNKIFTNQKGFTLIEMLVVVGIIAVLIAVAIPSMNGYTEKSKEAVDMANIRSATSELAAARLTEDRNATHNGVVMYREDNAVGGNGCTYVAVVPLSQAEQGWQSVSNKKVNAVGNNGECYPIASWNGGGGSCVITMDEQGNTTYVWMGTSDFISGGIQIAGLVTSINDAIRDNVTGKWNYGIINSGETEKNGQTATFLANIGDNSEVFTELNAKTWTIYKTKEQSAQKGYSCLEDNAIYWTTLDAQELGKDWKTDNTITKTYDENNKLSGEPKSKYTVPVIGYNATTGTYDVTTQNIKVCNANSTGKNTEYIALANFNNTDLSGRINQTQYTNYDDALVAYNYLLDQYNKNGTAGNRSEAAKILQKAGLDAASVNK